MDNSMKYIVIGIIGIIGVALVFYLVKNQQASNTSIYAPSDSHNVTKATSVELFKGITASLDGTSFGKSKE